MYSHPPVFCIHGDGGIDQGAGGRPFSASYYFLIYVKTGAMEKTISKEIHIRIFGDQFHFGFLGHSVHSSSRLGYCFGGVEGIEDSHPS